MFLLGGRKSKIIEEASEPAVCRIAFFVCGELEGRNPEGIKKAWVRLSVSSSRKAILPTK